MLRSAQTTYNFLISSLGYTNSLHQAVINRDALDITQLLDDSIVVDSQDSTGQTPLHIAAEKGFADMAAVLLGRGANLTIKDRREATPLYYATKSGHVDVVRLFLKRDPALLHMPCIGNDDEITPVQVAVISGTTEMVNVMCEFGAEMTPQLMKAMDRAKEKNGAINWYLKLHPQCDPDYLHDFQLFEGFFNEVLSGNINAVREALELRYFKEKLNTERNTLTLRELLENKLPTIFKRLNEDNHHTHYAINSKYKGTAIFQAVLNQDVEMVKLLVANGAKTDVAAKDLTLHSIAKELGNVEIIGIIREDLLTEKVQEFTQAPKLG